MTDDTRSSSAIGRAFRYYQSNLGLFIVLSIVLALALVFKAPHFAKSLHLGGDIFLNLLKMIVVPLVVTSVMCGIFGMGDIRKLGKPGGVAVLYYLTTTVLAVIVGLILVNLFSPGAGIDGEDALKEVDPKTSQADMKLAISEAVAREANLSPDQVRKVFPELEDQPSEWTGIVENLVMMLFTDNLFASATGADLLPLIVFSILFAGMLTTMGSKVGQLTTLIEQANNALLSFIMLLMCVAPVGILCMVAGRFGEAEADNKLIEELTKVGSYFVTVVVGLGFHALVTLPIIYWLVTKKNPYLFIKNMMEAILTAFSTASSSATLPVTIECASRKAGVSRKSSEFVLPLGATINMDGTALYEAAAALFIAQIYSAVEPSFDLSLVTQLVIAVTATLAAIGAAGIPEAGLVTMLIVLNAAGLPIHYIALILSVDWLLDRFRTAVNVFGDSVGAAVVDRTLGERTDASS